MPLSSVSLSSQTTAVLNDLISEVAKKTRSFKHYQKSGESLCNLLVSSLYRFSSFSSLEESAASISLVISQVASSDAKTSMQGLAKVQYCV